MSVISRFCSKIPCIITNKPPVPRLELRLFRTKRSNTKSSNTRVNKERYDAAPEPSGLRHSPSGMTSLIKPVLFAGGFSAAAISGCAIWQYENMRKAARRSRFPTSFDDYFGRKAGNIREEFNAWWKKLPENEKLFIAICALNCLVFCAWRVPALEKFMTHWFVSNPVGGASCASMLLSAFSHYSALHLCCNMLCLHSFMDPVINLLGKEQFVAVYLSSAVISSLGSHIYKVATNRISYSLGASGAIMTMIGIFGTLMPDVPLTIVFFPMFPFSAATAIKGMMLVDTVGMVSGWRFFDHACHLSGLLFGIFWCHLGSSLLWESREPLVKAWHRYRVPQPPTTRD